jgi:hypothetical protein
VHADYSIYLILKYHKYTINQSKTTPSSIHTLALSLAVHFQTAVLLNVVKPIKAKDKQLGSYI